VTLSQINAGEQDVIIYQSFHLSGYQSSILTRVKESAGETKQDNTT
jgi:hypothetical protein